MNLCKLFWSWHQRKTKSICECSKTFISQALKLHKQDSICVRRTNKTRKQDNLITGLRFISPCIGVGKTRQWLLWPKALYAPNYLFGKKNTEENYWSADNPFWSLCCNTFRNIIHQRRCGPLFFSLEEKHIFATKSVDSKRMRECWAFPPHYKLSFQHTGQHYL
jgi:hypothetical protein